MKASGIAVLVMLLTGVVSTCRANYTLSITSPSEGNWQAWLSLDGGGAGLATFGIDVYGSDGITVSSSLNKAPWYYDPNLFNVVGFTEYRSDGTNGVGIIADQKIVYGDAQDDAKDALVIQGVGHTAGSAGGISWGCPVLLAEGTYSGSTGYLHVREISEFGIYELAPFDYQTPSWKGPGNVSRIAPDIGNLGGGQQPPPNLADLQIPEPASIVAFLGLGQMLLRKRRKAG